MPLKLLHLLMLILMAVLVVACATIHLEVLQRWKTLSDKDHFNAEDIIYLKEKVDETFAVSDNMMEDLGNIKDEAMDELFYASEEVQNFIVTKIDRVLQKGEAFAFDAEKIDNDFQDMENKGLATEFSFCFISCSIISIWFWLHIISNQMHKRLVLFSITAISCIIFLMLSLSALYLSIVQAYLTDYIHPDSRFIQQHILAIIQDFGNLVLTHFQHLQFPAFEGLSS